MNTSLIPIITRQGLEATLAQHNRGFAATIAAIALGDGKAGAQGYTPQTEDGYAVQTQLENERERVVIADGRRINDRQLELSAIVESDQEYAVRELGFYLADGTLFAIWSDADRTLAWKSSEVPLILALELALSALPAESVTIQKSANAKPLELLMTGEVAAIGTALANLQNEQLNHGCLLREATRSSEGNMPALDGAAFASANHVHNVMPQPSWDSGWFSIAAQAGAHSHRIVLHPLQRTPLFWIGLVKPDLNSSMTFSVGVAHTVDDDANEYGGVVIAAHADKFEVWAPDRNNGSPSGRVIMVGDGWGGEVNRHYIQSGFLKILAWS